MTAPADPPAGVRFVLVTGRLSLAAAAELERRVRAGENELRVRVELLEREGKAIASEPPAAEPESAR